MLRDGQPGFELADGTAASSGRKGCGGDGQEALLVIERLGEPADHASEMEARARHLRVDWWCVKVGRKRS